MHNAVCSGQYRRSNRELVADIHHLGVPFSITSIEKVEHLSLKLLAVLLDVFPSLRLLLARIDIHGRSNDLVRIWEIHLLRHRT